ncbi:MAG TPA: PIN domain-containing protein [Microthrixaceae bacterium]|nr:PIN domain-containing protein [Microthrixaceae bacterium]HNI35776.1 PIN domain-containing protein [Microthrixaceae bacterium]
MIVVDTNLLLYAVFDAFDQHEATVEWWEAAIGRGEIIGAAANLTTDAQIAALALEHGATVASSDTDFHRFPRLSFVIPLEP